MIKRGPIINVATFSIRSAQNKYDCVRRNDKQQQQQQQIDSDASHIDIM